MTCGRGVGRRCVVSGGECRVSGKGLMSALGAEHAPTTSLPLPAYTPGSGRYDRPRWVGKPPGAAVNMPLNA
jgi:hypothetical protein